MSEAMRVITGTARGRKLLSVEGLETRPTSDRTKESIFNIIQFDIEGRRVLDLFAGTGQMGIEALSRGAESAVFVDRRADCVRVIRENLKRTGFEGAGTAVEADYRVYLSRAQKGGFGLVFLDPPYGEGLLPDALRLLFQGDLLMTGGLIVCEGHRDEALPDPKPPYYEDREYLYGKSKIKLFIKRQQAPL